MRVGKAAPLVASRSGAADTCLADGPGLSRGGWAGLPGGAKGYARGGGLAKGWLGLGGSKYCFEADGTLVRGAWRDVVNDLGVANRYYFRPSGAMATGWATIDGRKYWFRPSGNMATGFADVDDGHKRCFDPEGRMLTGWQEINGNRYYFRPSGAMQTGEATIGGVRYTFTGNGTLIR